MPADVLSLRRHVQDRFEAARLEHSPFPHLEIPHVFPPDVYAEILRLNPFHDLAGTEWLPRAASSNVSARTPYHARKQIDLRTIESAELLEPARAFWRTLRDCFVEDDWFARLVVAAYPEYFRLRFGDLLGEDDFYALMTTQIFLQRHEPGFTIGPHTDLPTRVFTALFTFAERDGFEEYGTQLLAPKDRLVRCWGADHYEREDFDVRKTVPYRPNGFLLFFKTRHSFHAVAPVSERVPNQRYGMQLQFHEPVNGVFRDLSVPDLMTFPRPR